MKVIMAVACESAVEKENSLSLLGTFDRIEAAHFPVVRTQCALAVQIQWQKNEEGRHTIRAHFMNADGATMLRDLESTIRFQVPEPLLCVTTHHIITLQQLTFSRPGLYMASILVDDRHQAEIHIQVVAAEKS